MNKRERRFFHELTPLANAIDNLPKGDGLAAELFAKDDDFRKSAADAKRKRRAERNRKQLEKQI